MLLLRDSSTDCGVLEETLAHDPSPDTNAPVAVQARTVPTSGCIKSEAMVRMILVNSRCGALEGALIRNTVTPGGTNDPVLNLVAGSENCRYPLQCVATSDGPNTSSVETVQYVNHTTA